MAKHVFRSAEINVASERVTLAAPSFADSLAAEALEQQALLEPEEEYTGPTAAQLREEAEAFEAQWAIEKQNMISKAEQEAAQIIEQAKEQAAQIAAEEAAAATEQRERTEAEVQNLREAAEAETQKLRTEVEAAVEQIRAEAVQAGRDEGHVAGYQEGRTEAQRVIERFHVVLAKAIERRHEIIRESEEQVVHLVLSIARKVVKVISESHREVVIANIEQALTRLQQKSDVVVRVNLADLPLVTEQREELLQSAERAGKITIAEDTTIDPGGCVIETDFGEIDARIAAQLQEIEDRILEIVPVKTRRKRKALE
jgi:flagellar assembly protein FliH